ncbi:MAG TPA: hypothetical protein PLZ71_06610 [Flavobacterium alvei]|nr:hypothetical protein [Flavobacterium alvei]HQF48313.1 hypothetical protein [Flavobacterium alvei]
MKNNLLKYYITAFYLCSTFVMFAQPTADDTTGTLESGDTPAPIDDYVWVLALIGLFFIFMKFKAMLNNKIQE